ncbi:MAG: DUF4156 domain-containing protein [Gammaproteobacteria bacterium]|nr:DUF4156 domain-containing protein [Gammaproteobacteria bacterium]
MRTFIILVITIVVSHGCAWVELSDQGQQVRVIDANAAQNCEHLGQTTATVADSVAGVKRRADIVQANLEKLARNTAADMKGNAVVATSKIVDGKQRFDVYRCGN